MVQPRENMMQRRSVLKAAGGLAAAAAVGGHLSGAALASHDDGEYRGVRVNQVGYPIDGTKRAIVTSQAMDVQGVSSFEVVDADTGESVYQGELMDETLGSGGDATNPWSSTDAVQDEAGTDHLIKYANFTDLEEPGEYVVVVGDEESYPFRIGEASEIYAPVLRDVGRLYTLKRSNTRIEDPYTGLEIGPGHTQDEQAIIAEPIGDWLEDYEAGDTIDVSHGWYDAGDYGKYVNPAAISVAQLMLAYERNPDAFHVGQFYIDDVVDDEDLGDLPDVLVECKEELRFLEQMQRPNGSLFYKVAGNQRFPDDDVAPEDDDMDRYVFGTSSVGTAHACGAFAMAARIYRAEGDGQFADRMQDNALAAWEWLEDNPDLVWEESENQNEGSGAYGRNDYDEPDRFWAAAELLRTTEDDYYDQWIQNTDLGYDSFGTVVEDLPAEVEAPIDWNNPVGLGNYAYFWADGDLAGTSHTQDGTAAAGLNGAFWVTERYTGDMDGEDADYWTTGVYDFYWGHLKSGLSRAVQGIWSMEMHEEIGNAWITNQPQADLVAGPLHHALGRSATGHSFVTGHGEKSTENPHDRIVQSQDALIPGMLVGGGHNDGLESEDGDCTSEHVDSDTPHLMSYLDEHCSYATNEWAINYTAPLFMMLAEVVGEITETPEPETADGGDPGDGDDCEDGVQVGDNCARDTTGDGLYDDFNGDGSTTTSDVTSFFDNVQNPDVTDNAGYFDFDGNGDVTISDVIELFESL